MSEIQLSQKQGLQLVYFAFCTISDHLGVAFDRIKFDQTQEELKGDIFCVTTGTFVTLKKNSNLRGCIGNIVSDKSIVDGVRVNAINAAFNDYRFTPLQPDELSDLHVEVSILTPPQKLEYSNAEELRQLLKVDIDGVIIRKNSASATFLPQVWCQLPNVDSFLSQLCLKAGLSADGWKDKCLEVETYQVQCFSDTFQ